jgi:transcriptional regulator with XRE-family HTH domain
MLIEGDKPMDKDEKRCRELLSRNIKRFRERLGFSQLDLSLELEISTTFLSDIETCHKWVSPKTLAKIASVLKVEVYELFKPDDAEHDGGISPDISAEVVKYLDVVDDTLVKQIIHSIQPAIEKTIKRAVAKTRRYYEKQVDQSVKVLNTVALESGGKKAGGE